MNKEPNAFYDEKPEGEDPKREDMEEAVKLIKENVPILIERFLYISNLPQRTPEEDKEFLEISETVLKLLPYIDHMKSTLFERIYKRSVGIYYAIKESADKGNAESQKVVEELKPLFEQALREDINLS